MVKNLVMGGCVYNEEDKFLVPWLESLKKITDKIFIIDDGSTDNTLSICEQYTSNILQTNRMYYMGENKIRSLWWDKASELINDGDFIFPLDADEIFTDNSILHFEEEIYKAQKNDADAMAVDYYDMWNEKEYRDEPEKGWVKTSRPMVNCIKINKNKKYLWYDMYIHCGSVPSNAYYSAFPSKLQIKHYAFSNLELRKNKIKFYEKYDPYDIIGGKNKEYASFLDENPKLYPFIDNYEKDIIVEEKNRWPRYTL